MNVREQLDALRSMNISPAGFLFMPRILAGLITFPMLTVFADLVSIICAWYFSWVRYGIHWHTFFNNMKSYFEPFDLWSGLIKSSSSVSDHFYRLLFGDRSSGGAEGVGKSTTLTVVYSSVTILIMDFIVAWILFGAM